MNRKNSILVLFITMSILLSACTKTDGQDSSSSTTKPSTSTTQASETTTKPSVQNTETGKTVVGKKLDESKPYVYAIPLSEDDSLDSYVIEDFQETVYAKDITFPYFNIDSPDAENANMQIEYLRIEMANYFNDYTLGFMNPKSMTATFSFNEVDGIVSTICTYNYAAYDFSVDEYFTLNIDLETGKKISFKEMLDRRGILNTYEDKIETYISDKVDLMTGDIANPDSAKSLLLGSNLKLYWDAFLNDAQHWYIDENNHLMLAGWFYVPAGAGRTNEHIDVDELAEKPKESNPIWKAYKIPEDQIGAMLFLGAGSNDMTRADISKNLKKISEKLNLVKGNSFQTPILLYRTDQSKTRDNTKGAPEVYDFYLFIPKYKTTIISMVAYEWTDNERKMYYEKNLGMPQYYAGEGIFVYNVTDHAPDTKFICQYRDIEFEIAPYLTFKEGEIIYPKEIFDLSTLFDLATMKNIGEDEIFNEKLETFKFAH